MKHLAFIVYALRGHSYIITGIKCQHTHTQLSVIWTHVNEALDPEIISSAVSASITVKMCVGTIVGRPTQKGKL